jgi:hypothetical protein
VFSDALLDGKSFFESGEDTVSPIPASFANAEDYFRGFTQAVTAEAKWVVREAMRRHARPFRIAITAASPPSRYRGSKMDLVLQERVPWSKDTARSLRPGGVLLLRRLPRGPSSVSRPLQAIIFVLGSDGETCQKGQTLTTMAHLEVDPHSSGDPPSPEELTSHGEWEATGLVSLIPQVV